MRNYYYHLLPTCPYCHSPHCEDCINYVEESPEGKLYFCPNCGAYFRHSINLRENEVKFQKIIGYLISKRKSKNESKSFLEELENFPIVWGIHLNRVEEEYVDWIKKIKSGKFLITWPSYEVKFIPILISEYMNDNDKKVKVVVISRLAEGEDSNSEFTEWRKISSPEINEVYEKLISLDLNMKSGDYDELCKEIRSIDHKYFYKKSKKIFYRIRKLGNKSNNSDERPCEFNNLRKCSNLIKKKIQTEYGENSIRKFKIIKSGKNTNYENSNLEENKNGFIDVTIREREVWPQKRLNFNKNWFCEIILNIDKIQRISRKIPYFLINERSDFNDEKFKAEERRLFFISSKMKSSDIFEIVSKIHPDLVIFENSDEFIAGDYDDPAKKTNFINFLKNSNNFIILMFSTNRELRYNYKINVPDSTENPQSIISLGVIPHTWDHEIVLKKLNNEYPSNQEELSKYYPGPLSSDFFYNNLYQGNQAYELEGIIIDDLNNLYNQLDDLIKNFAPEDKSLIRGYMEYLFQTPLRMCPTKEQGHYDYPDIYKYYKKDGNPFSYANLFSHLFGEYENNSKIVYDLKNAVDETYKENNPILEKLSEKIKVLLSDENNFIIVIVKQSEVKGTEIILKEKGYEEQVKKEKIKVLTWKNFGASKKLSIGNLYILTSTLPTGVWLLEKSNLKKIIFIGIQKYFELFKKFINKRLDDTFCRPLYKPSSEEQVPELLRRIMNDLDIPNNETIMEITEKITNLKHYDELVNNLLAPKNTKTRENERVLILIDEKNQQWFAVPEGASLLTLDSDLEEVSIDNINDSNQRKSLIGKEILMDRRNVYIPFKMIFLIKIFEYNRKIRFSSSIFSWKDFRELYEDSIQWIEYIKDALDKYKQKYGEEAETEFIDDLLNLELSARDPSYIRQWWKSSDSFQLPSGYFIETYRVEHPRSRGDIHKIYDWLGKNFPNLNVGNADPDKCYDAAILIQRIRRKVLKKDIGDDPDDNNYIELRNYFKKEKENLIQNSSKFYVSNVVPGITAVDMDAYQLKNLKDDGFENYLKN